MKFASIPRRAVRLPWQSRRCALLLACAAVTVLIVLAACDPSAPSASDRSGGIRSGDPPSSDPSSAPTSGKASGGPNIILIVVDTLRADHLGCYGYARATSPTLDRLATEGVLFEQCYSAASWTAPSVASMFTSLPPMAHGCYDFDDALPASTLTLAETLRHRGYHNIAVVSNPHLLAKLGFGRGFDVYDDTSVFERAERDYRAAGRDAAGELPVREVVTGGYVTERAVELLRQASAGGKPFFLFCFYFDPHDSYVPPPPYDRMFDADYTGPIDGRRVLERQDSPPAGRDLEHLQALYDGEIAYTDQQVATLLTEAARLSPPERTLTVILADHGEAFGERGHLRHGNNTYREEVRVPMIWHWPGTVPAGTRVPSNVSTLDLTPTLAALLGVECGQLCQGVDQTAALQGQVAAGQRRILSERAFGPQRYVALTDGPWRLHIRFDRQPAAPVETFLYNVADDPAELYELASVQALRARTMSRAIQSAWDENTQKASRLRAAGGNQATSISPDELQKLKSLGYIK